MLFHQFYLGCLAHASYLIGSRGDAVVVDPQRDVDHYISEAESRGLRIRYVVETHLHADFVSGHRELAARTGAQVVFGHAARAEMEHVAVRDGDVLTVGEVTLRAIETPGHTPESMCWLVTDRDSNEPVRLLTGDTLFIGDVGRPDLAGSRGYTTAQMAALLYDSLHTKLLALDDAVEVWPAHGAGSSCGRNISKDRSSTIGIQRRLNYALQPMSREAFVDMMTRDLPPAPRYFPMDAEINRHGARPLADLGAPSLSPEAVKEQIAHGAIVLDVRPSGVFSKGYIPGAINIGLDGQFASWAGTLLSPEQRLIIVADGEEKAREAIMRLARVGLENVAGILEGGVAGWLAAGNALETTSRLDPPQLRESLEAFSVLDVRRRSEFSNGHVPGATNVPLDELPGRLSDIPRAPRLAVICAGGYRSSIAASLLRREGIGGIVDVAGGTQGWIGAGFETA